MSISILFCLSIDRGCLKYVKVSGNRAFILFKIKNHVIVVKLKPHIFVPKESAFCASLTLTHSPSPRPLRGSGKFAVKTSVLDLSFVLSLQKEHDPESDAGSARQVSVCRRNKSMVFSCFCNLPVFKSVSASYTKNGRAHAQRLQNACFFNLLIHFTRNTKKALNQRDSTPLKGLQGIRGGGKFSE